MMHPYRLCLVPRWSGTATSDWYPWLQVQLADELPKRFDPIVIPELPEAQEPRLDTWVPATVAMLGNDPAVLATTILVGHSVGCQTVLRALSQLPPGTTLAGTLCVAGWWDVDEPWDSIKPWIEVPFDEAAARRAAGRLVVLLSDNDRFTSDYRANQAAWERRLGAEVRLISGADHFNGVTAPAVMAALTSFVESV